ncbi:MAG: VPLPA-CTERM sorting domain-containing protein [Sedimenticola sp.]
MKISRLFSGICIFTIAILSTSVNASLVVPAGLNPGDNYHVVFVSSTTRGPTSSDISDYDTHVQNAADAAGIGTSIGLNWRAIVSTETVDAITHLGSLFSDKTTIPIYNQNGDLVASSFDDMWGILSNPILYDESGNINRSYTYTGTNIFGVAADPLGNAGGYFTYGNPPKNGYNWVDMGSYNTLYDRAFYGMSAEATVAGVVPIPAAAWLFGSGLLGLIGFSKRKKAA